MCENQKKIDNAMVSPDNVEQSLRNLSLAAPDGQQGSGSDTDCDNRSLKWHLPLKELYKMACAFYKGKCVCMRGVISDWRRRRVVIDVVLQKNPARRYT